MFWGTGVGGGLILDGKPWLGRGGAGEIGHMVVKLDGAHCPCGRRGCVEAYAGRAAMEAKARREHDEGAKTDLFKIMKYRGRERLTSAVWAHASSRGIRWRPSCRARGRGAGAGIASAVNLLDVEAVVIGGGLGVRFGQPMTDRISRRPAASVPRRPPPDPRRGARRLGGALGAALLGPSDSGASSPRKTVGDQRNYTPV